MLITLLVTYADITRVLVPVPTVTTATMMGAASWAERPTSPILPTTYSERCGMEHTATSGNIIGGTLARAEPPVRET
jgi:hypothetical protein